MQCCYLNNPSHHKLYALNHIESHAQLFLAAILIILANFYWSIICNFAFVWKKNEANKRHFTANLVGCAVFSFVSRYAYGWLIITQCGTWFFSHKKQKWDYTDSWLLAWAEQIVKKKFRISSSNSSTTAYDANQLKRWATTHTQWIDSLHSCYQLAKS